MKKIAYVAFASIAALALTACGSSESANEEATPENVEMPAEEAIGGIDPAAPVVDDTVATDAAATATPTDDASAAVEAATADAEKKM